MKGDVFVDTNILVYAYDVDSGEKYRRAVDLVSSLWASENAFTSTQVIQEFYVTVTQKIAHPLPVTEARAAVTYLRAWDIHRPDVDDILLASELAEHGRFSFWDGLIVQSALRSGATTLLTEDLQHGLKINQLVVHNPFLD